MYSGSEMSILFWLVTVCCHFLRFTACKSNYILHPFAHVELNTLLLPLGVIPALFFLYFIIGDHEGKFKERYIFLMFVAGIIIGAFIYLMEGMTLYPMLTEAIYLNVVIVFSLVFSFLEQLAKLAVLNMKRFSDDGLPLYGASFGFGFSSTLAPLLFGRTLELGWENAMLFVLPIAALMINGSTGMFIAVGIKRNMRKQYFFVTVMMGAIMWLFLLASVISSLIAYHTLSWVSAACALVYAGAIMYVTYREGLPRAMMSRRELRKLL